MKTNTGVLTLLSSLILFSLTLACEVNYQPTKPGHSIRLRPSENERLTGKFWQLKKWEEDFVIIENASEDTIYS